MESSNEAAETLATTYGRASFIKHMNDKAVSLGLKNTKFVDPSGSGEGNVSTPEDLFMLTKYINENRSFIFKITSGQIKSSAYGKNIFTNIGNYNSFAGDSGYVGGKVGKTIAAGETEIAVFNLPFASTTRPVVFIVLSSTNSKDDISKLLNYTSNSFSQK